MTTLLKLPLPTPPANCDALLAFLARNRWPPEVVHSRMPCPPDRPLHEALEDALKKLKKLLGEEAGAYVLTEIDMQTDKKYYKVRYEAIKK